jgi:hypothetical protein
MTQHESSMNTDDQDAGVGEAYECPAVVGSFAFENAVLAVVELCDEGCTTDPGGTPCP